jgi:3-oxoacyl-[acyl-carrier-protein] synthase-3
MRIEGIDIEAIFGCVPKKTVDNLAELTELVGAEKASGIVKATGFSVHRRAEQGEDVFDLALPAAQRALEGISVEDVAGVIAVSFSNRDRFPALSARLHRALSLKSDSMAYDMSMACSGWVYGLYAAVQLVKASGRKVLLVDGDVQSAWTDKSDPNTLAVMGDGASATLLAPGEGDWDFSFYTDGSGADALRCRDRISMDGFSVFRFVAGPVRRFIESFIKDTDLYKGNAPIFIPHQANMYMVRQLADALGLKDRLVGSGEKYANTGSSSASLSMADGFPVEQGKREPVLIAGFGAGLSAGVAATTIGEYRKGVVEI